MGGCYIRQEGKNVLLFFTLGWVLAEAPKKMFFKKRVLYTRLVFSERNHFRDPRSIHWCCVSLG